MWNKSAFQTPKKKHSSSLSNNHMISQQSVQPKVESSFIIKQLFQKFSNFSSTIDVDVTKANFNLIAYQKQDQKIKYDPQMIVAKLKQLQNRAEINRAEMELQARRKKKKVSLYKSPKNQFEQLSYNETYKIYKTNSKLLDMPVQDSESETQTIDQPHKGIARFHQLKKHSKILEYTMQKIKEKQNQIEKQKKFASERKLKIKNDTSNINLMGEQYGDFIFKNRNKNLNISHQNEKNNSILIAKKQTQNPQKIVEERYKRILTMKAKDKISQEVKNNPRCNQMINKQNQIILDLENESKSLSKQNFKKLKSRFAQIVNQLHKGDRKRKQTILPNLTAR